MRMHSFLPAILLLLVIGCQQYNDGISRENLAILGSPRLLGVPSQGEVTLVWGWLSWGSGYNIQDQSATPAGFELLMAKGKPESWAPVSNLEGHVTAHTIDDLSPGIDYFFQIKAYGDLGDTLWSNVVAIQAVNSRPARTWFEGAEVSRFWVDWSPNGDALTYVKAVGQEKEAMGVWVYDLQSGEESQWGGGQQPQWSPYGDQVVAVTDFDRNINLPDSVTGLVLLNAADSSVLHVGEGHLRYPIWSPDGERILFQQRLLASSTYQFYEKRYGVNSNDIPSSPLGEFAYWREPYEQAAAHPCWNPSGDALIYQRFSSKTYEGEEVFIQDIFSYRPNIGEEEAIVFSDWNDTHPSISPFGNRLAFVSDRSGQPGIWLYDLNSRRTTLLYAAPSPRVDTRNGQLTWAPDESKLAFNGWVNDSVTSLFWISLD